MCVKTYEDVDDDGNLVEKEELVLILHLLLGICESN